MTEIKTAQAWGHRSSPSALLNHAGRESAMFNVPYVIVHGLTVAEVHEAAALLKSKNEAVKSNSGVKYARTWDDCIPYPLVAVHGHSAEDVTLGLALLAKSREVCEWYLSENQHGEYDFCSSCDAEYQMRMPTFCPSCGRKVVVKDD